MSFITIEIYKTHSGKLPFLDWEITLDTKTKAIIRTRLDRVRLGNFGDSKRLQNGSGVCELRIDYGSGYRIYYGMIGMKVILLLTGGDKGSQSRDIEKAIQYWLKYKESYEK